MRTIGIQQRLMLPIICALPLLLAQNCLIGQQVSAIADREKSLETLQSLLNPSYPTFELRVTAVVNPFIGEVKSVEEPKEAVASVEKRPDPTPRPSRLTDQQALEMIDSTFNPRGSIMGGQRRLLLLDRGRPLAEGESFPAHIGEFSYDVHLREVTATGYTLQIGEATLQREFTRSSGARIDEPSN